MIFSKVIKFFRSIHVYAHCDICNEIICIDVNKDDIRNALQTGFYFLQFKHKNENIDSDDLDDNSHDEHTIAMYINQNYEVKRIKSYFGDIIPVMAVEGDRIPIIVRKIPAASVRIGMVTAVQYKVLQLCDGSSTLLEISEISNVPLDELNSMMDILREKGLINIIIRS